MKCTNPIVVRSAIMETAPIFVVLLILITTGVAKIVDPGTLMGLSKVWGGVAAVAELIVAALLLTRWATVGLVFALSIAVGGVLLTVVVKTTSGLMHK